ncbi:MAG: hypothetical protein QG554_1339 [Pseudomonadota bacterium]|nr:hypothetical protein [Pseudomonadota bacterium]
MNPPAGSTTRASWVGLAVVLLLVLGGTQAWSWWRQERQAAVVKSIAQPGQITMYTTNTCPYCAKARVWLDGHGVPWRECNVDQDAGCLATFQAQGAPGVPLLNVQGHWQLGIDPERLTRALQAEPRQPSPSTERSPRP